MKKYLWKSMQASLKSSNGNINWEVGKWQKHEGELKLCSAGFHASKRIIDAMSFVNCEILAKVEVKGKHLKEKNKQVWSEMKIVKAYYWTKEDSVKLAIYSAEKVIDIFEKEYPNDKRPREAIEAAKSWLENPSDKTVAEARAAREAAWAAWAAAAAAEAAARAAAWAARAAAWAAAEAAARAVAEAAREGILDDIEKYLLKEVKTLKEYEL